MNNFEQSQNNLPEKKSVSLKEKAGKTLRFLALIAMMGGSKEALAAGAIDHESFKKEACKVEEIIKKNPDQKGADEHGREIYKKTVEGIQIEVMPSGIFIKESSEEKGKEITRFLYDNYGADKKPTGQVKRYMLVEGKTQMHEDGLAQNELVSPKDALTTEARLNKDEMEFKSENMNPFDKRVMLLMDHAHKKVFLVDFEYGDGHEIEDPKRADTALENGQATYHQALHSFEKGSETEK
jgi:hypothetical protein